MPIKESRDKGLVWAILGLAVVVIFMIWGFNRACSGVHSKSPADNQKEVFNKP